MAVKGDDDDDDEVNDDDDGEDNDDDDGANEWRWHQRQRLAIESISMMITKDVKDRE